MIEIAKIFNVAYEPDPEVMQEEPRPLGLDGMLIDLDRNNLGGNGGGGGAVQPLGFKDFPLPPALPVFPNMPANKPFDYGPSSSAPFNYNIAPYPNLDGEKKDLNTNFLNVSNPHGFSLARRQS